MKNDNTIVFKPKIGYKNDIVKEGFKDIDLRLKYICKTASLLFDFVGHAFVMTESKTTEKQDKAVGRKHATHREGRAIDIRANHMEKELAEQVAVILTNWFNFCGAFSKGSGKRAVVVLHGEGDNRHFHIQVDRDFEAEHFPVFIEKCSFNFLGEYLHAGYNSFIDLQEQSNQKEGKK